MLNLGPNGLLPPVPRTRLWNAGAQLLPFRPTEHARTLVVDAPADAAANAAINAAVIAALVAAPVAPVKAPVKAQAEASAIASRIT